MSPSATRQILFSCLAEGVRHASGGPTGIAFHPQVFGLQRCAALEEAQRALARAITTMDEVVPREIVKVTVAAGKQKTCGDCICILCLLITF